MRPLALRRRGTLPLSVLAALALVATLLALPRPDDAHAQAQGEGGGQAQGEGGPGGADADRVRPTVESVRVVSSPADGVAYRAGEQIRVAVVFSEPVTVEGDARLHIAVGSRERWARYDGSGSQGATVLFAYVVRPVDADDDGISVRRNRLELRGGATIADADGNPARLRHAALVDDVTHAVDGDGGDGDGDAGDGEGDAGDGEGDAGDGAGDGGDGDGGDGGPGGADGDRVRPTVVSVRVVSSPADGVAYSAGEPIRVAVVFSEPVVVEGDARLHIVVGSRERWARYEGSVGGERAVFAYVVRPVDADDDGISVKRNRLELRGGATIADADGNPARLRHAALVDQAAHPVDGARPSSGPELQEQPPADTPEQVTGVEVVPGDGRLSLSWTAVDGADGYKVQWKTGAQSYSTDRQASTTAAAYVITGLTAGSTYDVRVAATKSGAADGAWSTTAEGTRTVLNTVLTVALKSAPSTPITSVPAAGTYEFRVTGTGWLVPEDWMTTRGPNRGNLGTFATACLVPASKDPADIEFFEDCDSDNAITTLTAFFPSVTITPKAGSQDLTTLYGTNVPFSLGGQVYKVYSITGGAFSIDMTVNVPEQGVFVSAGTVRELSESGVQDIIQNEFVLIEVAAAAKPSAPSAPTVTAPSASGLAVRWAAVADATSYDVQYREGSTGDWTDGPQDTTTTSATVSTALKASTTYQARVRASNDTGDSDWSGAGSVTTPANWAPAFAAARVTRSVAENSAEGTAVGAPVAATDPDSGDTLTYALGGADASSFSIDASTGQIQVKDALDHETKSSYAVTVSVHDNKAPDGSASAAVDATVEVAISVTNADDAGTVAFGSTAPTEAEALTATLADPDGGATGLTWTWTRLESAAATEGATLTGATTRGLTSSYTPVAADVGKWLRASVAYTDALGPNKATAATAAAAVGPATTLVRPQTPTVATPSATSLAVSWDAVANATSYDVQYRRRGQGRWRNGPQDVAELSATVTVAAGLRASTQYQARVRASNSAGDSEWSRPGRVTTPANWAPAFAAAQVTRSVAENSAEGTAVGAPVTATDPDSGDTLTYALGGTDASSFSIDASTGQIKVKAALDFETKSSYAVSVSVHDNKAPDGSASAAVDATVQVAINVTNADDAGTVAFGSAAPTRAEALTATLSDPDGSLTGLTWTWTRLDAADATAGTTLTGATSSDLTSSYAPVAADVGKWLRASVAYTDVLGPNKSAAATAAAAVVAAALPEVAGVTATPQVEQLLVSWTAYAGATGYRVQWRSSTQSFSTAERSVDVSSGTSRIVGGLAPSGVYTVRVSALKSGTAVAASEVSATVLATALDVYLSSDTTTAVTSVPAAGTHAFTVKLTGVPTPGWFVMPCPYPADGDPNNLATPTFCDFNNFKTVARPPGSSGAFDATFAFPSVTVPSEGIAFAVISGSNYVGYSLIDIAAATAAPSAPSAPTVTAPSLTGLEVAWTEVTGAVSYDVQYREGDSGAWSDGPQDVAGTTATVTATLKPATRYQARVRATNTVGDSAWSAPGSVTTPSAPSAPSAPTVTAPSLAGLGVAWTGVTGAVSYDVQYREGDSGAWSDGPQDVAGTTATVTATLKPATRYQARVRATNIAGDSAWSAPGSVTTPAGPAAPGAPTVTVSSRTALGVAWAEVTGAVSYDVQYREGDSGAWSDGPQDVAGTTATVTVTLKPATQYQARVRATNATGDSAWSASGSVTTPAGPAAPGAPTVTVSSATALGVAWAEVTGAVNYDVQYREGDSGAWSDGPQDVTATTATVTATLKPGTQYQARVRAGDALFDSGWSAAGSATSPAGAAIESVAVTSTPASDDTYVAGETITVTVTFDRAVTVTGKTTEDGTDNPWLRLDLSGAAGSAAATARADYGATTGAAVTFSYEVAAGDNDTDGVAVAANAVELNGASITANGFDAALTHEALASQGSHKVATPLATLSVHESGKAASITAVPYAGEHTLTVKGANWVTDWTTGYVLTGGEYTAVPRGGLGTFLSACLVPDEGFGGTDFFADVEFFETCDSDGLATNLSIIGISVTPDAAAQELTKLYATKTVINFSGFMFPVSQNPFTITDGSFTTTMTIDVPAAGVYVSAATPHSLRPDTLTTMLQQAYVELAVAAPAAPTVTAPSPAGLEVTWSAAPDATGYDVQYRQGTEGEWSDGPQDTTATTASITTALTASTTYQVRIRASYSGGDSSWSAPATVTTPANWPPVFDEGDDTTRSVAENSAAGTAVGAAVAASDPDMGDVLVYSLGGADASVFDIDSGSGQIKVKDALDYEADSSYSVTVSVHDGKAADNSADTTADDTIAVTVSVTNVDEAGAVTFDSDAPRQGAALSATLADPDGGVTGLVWTWTRLDAADSVSGTALSGATDSGLSSSYTPVAADVGKYLRASAAYTDAEAGSKTATAVTAAAVAARPKVTLVLDPASISENGGVSTVTATLDAAVPSRTVVTVTATAVLPAVASDFALSSNATLTIAANATASTGTVTVTAVDNDIDAADKTVTVSGTVDNTAVDAPGSVTLTITDDDAANTAPSFDDGDDTTRSVAENSDAGAAVGAAVAASDPDGDTLTYSLGGADASVFDIDTGSGQIKVKDALDYETDASYSVEVSVHDGKAADNSADTTVDDTITVTVNVTNVDEAGSVTFGSDAPKQGEALTVTLADPDGGVSGLSWTWTRLDAADSTEGTALSGATDSGLSSSYTPVAADVGKWLRASAAYTDAEAGSKAATAVTAAAVAARPKVTLVLDPASISENGGVSTVTATLDTAVSGVTRVTVSAEAVSPAEAGDFTLSANAVLTIAADATTSTGTVTVTAVDNDIDAADKTVTVSGTVDNTAVDAPGSVTLTITDDDAANTAPSFDDGDDTTRSVAENSAAGAAVGAAVAATDPDGDTLVYSLGGTDASVFDIDTGSGQIKVKDALDYETDASYSVVVSVHDGKAADNSADTTADDTITVTVNVTNVDEAGTVTFGSDAPKQGEALSATLADPDGGVTGVVWTWTRLDAADSTEGTALSGATDSGLSSSYTPVAADVGKWLRASAAYTDAEAGSKTATAVTAAAVTAKPKVTLVLMPASITENGGVSTVTATLDAAVSGVTRVTVSAEAVSPAEAGDFTLSTNATLTIAANATASTGTVTVTAQDNDIDAADKTVTVSGTVDNAAVDAPDGVTLTITDDDAANTAPSFDDGDDTTRSVAENSDAGTAVGAAVAASDPDGDTLTYSLGASTVWSATLVVDSLEVFHGCDNKDSDQDNCSNEAALDDDDVTYRGVTYMVEALFWDSDSNVLLLAFDIGGAEAKAALSALTLHADGAAFAVSDARVVRGGALLWPFDPDSDWTDEQEISLRLTETVFSIDADSGQIKVKDALDYEADSSYSVVVSVHDGRAADNSADTTTVDDTITVTVNVTNVEEAGAVTFGSDAPKAGAALTATLADPDGGVSGLAWTWTRLDAADSVSGTALSGATDSGLSSSYTPVADDVDKYLRAAAAYTDAEAGSKAATAVTAAAVTAKPKVTLVLDPASITENGGVSTITATLDTAVSGVTRVTVSAEAVSPAEAGDFTLSTNKVLTIAADATTSTGTVTITAVDNDIDAADKTVTVSGTVDNTAVDAPASVTLTITDDDDANTAPSFDDGDNTTRSVAENSDAGTAVGAAVAATDPDGDTLTYSLGGADASVFDIDTDSGQIKVKDALDYETDTSYSVAVSVHDGKAADNSADTTADDTITVTVNVTNVDEAGRVTFGSDAPKQGAALTATLADPDGGVSGLSWTWTRLDAADSTEGTALSGATDSGLSSSYTPVAADVGKWLRASAAYSDAEAGSKAATAVTAAAVTAKPKVTLVLDPASISENGGVSTVTATLDTAVPSRTVVTVTATAVLPAVASDFALSSNATLTIAANATTSTGTVTVTAVDNDIDAADKTVTVSGTVDNTAVDAPASVTLTITDDDAANTAPSFDDGDDTTRSVAENSDAGAAVGAAVAATDPDGDTLTYSLGGTDASVFDIDTDSGQIKVKDALDYETDTSYSVEVSVHDGRAADNSADTTVDDTITVTVNVTNVDEAGRVTFGSDAPKQGAALTATLADPDGGVSGLSWTWTRLDAADSTEGTALSGATDSGLSSSYTPVAADVGKWLRASAAYSDAEAGSKAATAVTAAAVTAKPKVTLVLDPASITENGGVSTVTASLDTAVSGETVVTVTATAVPPAAASDFTLSTNKVLTIAANATTSTGTVTVTAVDNDIDAADKTVTVSGTVDNTAVDAPDSVTLTITDDDAANTAPAFDDGDDTARSVAENSTAGTAVGAAVAATDPDGDTLTYSLGGADAAVFDIDADSGQIKVKDALDYETDTSYSVAVSVHDGKAADNSADTTTIDDTITVTVNVTNVDEAGSVKFGSDAPKQGEALTATLADPDGGVTGLSWTWTRLDAADSTEGTALSGATDSGLSSSYTPVAADVDKYLRASAAYTDAEAGSKAATAVTAAAVTAKPKVTLVLDPASITENGGVSTVTATLDTAVSGVTRVTVSAEAVSPAEAGDFTLSANAVLTIAANATASTGSVTITAVDNDIDAADKTVTVSGTVDNTAVDAPGSVTLTITDDDAANTAPSFDDGENTTRSIAENSTAGAAVGAAVAATDPDGDTLTYSLGGADASVFDIDTGSGQIKVKDALDYETDTSYSVEVSVHDGRAADNSADTTVDDTIAVTVNVTNVDEAGAVTFGSDAPKRGEALTATLTDPDGGVSGLSWTWTRLDAADSTEGTALSGATDSGLSSSYTPVAADVDKWLRASAAYTDAEAGAKAATAVTAAAVTARPKVSLVLMPASISENGGVSTVTATLDTAVSGETVVTVTATAVAPAVASDFALSSNATLTIAANATTSTGTVTVTAVDNGIDAADKTVTVSGTVDNTAVDAPGSVTLTITDDDDANTAPSFDDGDDTARSVAENSNAGTAVGAAVAATDPDGDTLTYSLGGTDASVFDIDADSGQIKVKDALDYETDTSYSVMVSVHDGRAADNSADTTVDDTITVTVNVTNVDEAGRVTFGSDAPKRGEALSATLADPDGGVTDVVWTWTRLDAADSTEGTALSGATDSDLSSSYTPVADDVGKYLRASAAYTDAEAGSKAATAVTAAAVAAKPKVTLVLDPASISENGGVSTVTATLDAAVSGVTRVTVSAEAVSPAEAGDFTLSANAVLTIAADATASTGTVTITAVDNDIDAADKTVTVSGTVDNTAVDAPASVTLTITDDDDANTAPAFDDGENTTRSIAENSTAGAAVGAAVAATDPDGDTLTYSLGGADASVFDIDTGSGQIKVKDALDYETDTSYSVVVSVHDGKAADNSADTTVDDTITVTVNVTNVDEAGTVTFGSDAPRAATALSATLADPDGGVAGVVWTWTRLDAADSTEGTALSGATDSGLSSSYTPVAADVDKYLRASAAYTDAEAGSKTATAVTAAAVAAAPVAVAPNWEFVPKTSEGVALFSVGESFRLLFVTSTTTAATSTSIASYNTFVQSAAAKSAALRPFSSQFKAVVSTASTHARDNTATTYTNTDKGLPVYWVGGAKVADDYADFYDGTWANQDDHSRTETGGATTGSFAWTGSYDDGTRHTAVVGTSNPRAGMYRAYGRGVSPSPLSKIAAVVTRQFPLYGLSPVIVVVALPTVSAVAVTSSAGDDDTYAAGDVIEVTVTFSEAVVVTGTPQLTIKVGEADRVAGCALKGSTGDDAERLVCSYTVAAGDADDDGIEVERNKLDLNEGTIKDADGNAAALTHAALAAQSGHKVDTVAPTVSAVAVTSSAGADSTYTVGDAIEVTVTFSEAVTVTGTPQLTVKVGDNERQADYSSGSGAAALVFSYTVAAGDFDSDGIEIEADKLDLNGGTIKDTAGNDAALAHDALGAQAGHRVGVNTAPAFDDGDDTTRSVAENSDAGAAVGAAVAASDPDGDTLTYSLGGTDAAVFDIDTDSGQIKVKDALDYETDTSYSVTVSVHDGKAADNSADTTVDDTITVTVNVTNVDEAGTVTFGSDAPRAATALTATLADPDGGVTGLSWTWTRLDAADSASGTALSGATGSGLSSSYTPVAADIGKYLRASAAYTDAEAGSKTATAVTATAVTAAAVTAKPEVTLVLDPVSISESGGVSTVTATLDTAVSGVTKITVTATAVAPAAASDFTLSTNKVLTIAADATTSTGTVTVIAVDNDIDAADKTVTVSGTVDNTAVDAPGSVTLTITDDDAANTAPSFDDGDDTARSVAENSDAGTAVGAAVAASDPDGDTLTYSLGGADASVFDIDADSGQIRVKDALDYETDSSYSVTVSVHDGRAADNSADTTTVDDTIAVTVNVTNVDEAGTVTFGSDAPRAATALTATLADPDGGVTGLVWTWTRLDAADSVSGTALSGATDSDLSSSYTPVAADVGKWLRASVAYTDAEAGSKTATAVTAAAVTARPKVTLVLMPVSITENGGVSTITATLDTAVSGVTKITVTATAVAPAAASDFTLSANKVLTIAADATASTGTVTVTAADNDIDAADKTVTVSGTVDNTAVDAPEDVTLTITDDDAANTAPSFDDGDDTARSVAENSDAGTAVGAAVAASDPDGDTLTYSLGGADASVFDIDADSGQIRVKDALDYETDTSYSVTVSVHDGKAADNSADTTVDDTITVTVNVTNVDEAGTVTFGSDAPKAATALTATLADPDGSVTGLVWTWTRLDAADSVSGTALSGATDGGLSSSYTPVAADVGKWLRAAAAYSDAEAGSKTATAVTEAAVTEATTITVTASGPAGDRVTSLDAFDVTLTFGEKVRIAAGSISVENGSVTSVPTAVSPDSSGLATVWTVEVTPAEPEARRSAGVAVTDPFDVVVTVVEGAYRTGGKVTALTTYTVIVDLPLRVTLQAEEGRLSLGGVTIGGHQVTIRFSEPVKSDCGPDKDACTLTAGEVAVTNGFGRSFGGAGQTYAIFVWATSSQDVTVSVAAGAVAAAAGGEGNAAASIELGGVSVARPGAAITGPRGTGSRRSLAASYTDGVIDPFEITVTFDVPVTGLAASDFWLGHATVSDPVPQSPQDGYAKVWKASVSPTWTTTVHVLLRSGRVAERSGMTNTRSDYFWVTVEGNPPSFGQERVEFSVDENAGSVSGMAVAATDPDTAVGDRIAYSLSGPDAWAFEIGAYAGSGRSGPLGHGAMRVRPPQRGNARLPAAAGLDYETKSSYSFTVTATDRQGKTDSIEVTLRVDNVDEPGTVTLSKTEGVKAGDQITAALTDPDGNPTSITWSWERSADGTSWSTVNGAASATYTVTTAEARKHLRARASYSDGHGDGKAAASEAVLVAPTAPEFAVESVSRTISEDAAEGTTLGAPVTATDADGDELRYFIQPWTSGGAPLPYRIDRATGQIYVNQWRESGLSYERASSHTLTVWVYELRDIWGPRRDSYTINVTVTDVEENGRAYINPSVYLPRPATALTADVSDPDGGLSSVTWQWARATSRDGPYTNITGATSASYTPVTADAGHHLRATATYTDRRGSGKTAAETIGPVLPPRQTE